MLSPLKTLAQLASAFRRQPRAFLRAMGNVVRVCRGCAYADAHATTARSAGVARADDEANPLREYFERNKTGPGIWKWEHYFEIYHRHFRRFIGTPARVLEIGVYSGGSLPMWRHYFGQQCHVHGVDIEPACKAYEAPGISVHIGDQEDRVFWRRFREQVDGIDVLVDDGGHTPEQQMVTLEEMLPHLRPGGVYLCEDIVAPYHQVAAFASGLVSQLNAKARIPGTPMQATPTAFQRAVHSIHFYPYVVVIEKTAEPPVFRAPKHGTEWQPFL